MGKLSGGDSRRLPVRAVVLDADNTLWSLSRSIGTIYEDACAKLGVEVSAEEIDGRLKSIWPTFQREYLNEARDFSTSPTREKEVWREFVSRLIADRIETRRFDDLFEVIYNAFAEPTSRTIFPDVLPFLESLRRRGLKVALFSNNDERLIPLAQGFGLKPLVTKILTAGLVGWKKPSPRAFLGVADALEVPIEATLFIGDDVKLDYEAAIRAGGQAVWLDRSGKTHPREIWSAVVLSDSLLSRTGPEEL